MINIIASEIHSFTTEIELPCPVIMNEKYLQKKNVIR